MKYNSEMLINFIDNDGLKINKNQKKSDKRNNALSEFYSRSGTHQNLKGENAESPIMAGRYESLQVLEKEAETVKGTVQNSKIEISLALYHLRTCEWEDTIYENDQVFFKDVLMLSERFSKFFEKVKSNVFFSSWTRKGKYSGFNVRTTQ